MAQQIDDLSDEKPRKKGIHSGNKGNRGEHEVCKEFNARFAKLLAANPDKGVFVKASGSGAFGHGSISKSAKNTLVGDITAPDGFLWVLESKLGYNDIDLCNAFYGGCSELDEFLKQVESDAGRSNQKRPLLLWRKDRKKRLAFLKTKDLPVGKSFEYSMQYRDWTAISVKDLLEFEDEFFFDCKTDLEKLLETLSPDMLQQIVKSQTQTSP